MRTTITGKNINVTAGLREAVEDRLSKLDKYFSTEPDAIVTLSVEKDRQKIEVTIPMKGTVIRSEQVSNDMYVSIDLVEEVIERQLKKYKKKIVDRKQGGGSFFEQAFLEEESEDTEDISIIRTKRFEMKPMYPEDACIQMELLGHDFYMFLNAETESLAVVYRRKGGKYGMIEPED